MERDVLDIVKEYFPNATDKECNFILWEYTGFPTFFAPKPGQSVEDVLREQLAELKQRSPEPGSFAEGD